MESRSLYNKVNISFVEGLPSRRLCDGTARAVGQTKID